jgi:site-specific recombinase XerD
MFITASLQQATATLGTQFGISPVDVSVHFLRASSAMALLNAGVDNNWACDYSGVGAPMREDYIPY